MKRKNFIINRPFQFRIILALILIVVFALNLQASLIYTFLTGMIDISSILPVSEENIILPSILMSFLLSSIVIICLGIFMSHSMAGPVYRFEKAIETVTDKDLTVSFALRKDDEFKHLASLINSMVKKLNEELLATEGKIGELKKKADMLESSDEEELKALTADMKKTIYELTVMIQKFKLNKSRD